MTVNDAYQRISQACEQTFARYHYERIRDPNPAWLSGDRCQLYQGSIPSVEYWRLSLEYPHNFIVLEKIAAEDLPQNVCWVDIWPARLNWQELTEQSVEELASECQAELIAWLV